MADKLKYIFGVVGAGLVLGGGLILADTVVGDGTQLKRLAATNTGTSATGCRYSATLRGVCAKCPDASLCDIDGQPRIDLNPPQGCATNSRADSGADEYYAPGCEPYVGSAPLTTTTVTTTPSTPTLDQVYQSYRLALPTATLYKSWKAANPGESTKLDAYFGAVDHGLSYTASPPPVLATATGRALVAAAEERQVGK